MYEYLRQRIAKLECQIKDLLDLGAGPNTNLIIQDEGTSVDPAASTLNFVGSGVTVTNSGSSTATVTIPGGGGGSGDVDLAVTKTATTNNVTNTGGTDAVLEGATISEAGLMVATDKTKLNSIETGATSDQTGAEIVFAIDTELGGTTWQSGGGGGGGSSYAFYDLGNNAYVFATDTGVTFAKNPTTGELTFNVPSGVLISGGGVLIASGDTDGSNDAYIQLNFLGSRDFNQGIGSAWKPTVEATNGKAVISRGNPSFKSNTVQTAITAVGSNNIEVLVDDAGTLFPDILLTFVLP